MSTKDRIIQFIDYKQLSKRRFCEMAGLSHTIFNSNSAMGSDKLEMISASFQELNMDWAVTGRGEMLYSEKPNVIVGTDGEAAKAVVVLKDQVLALQADLIKCFKEKEELTKAYRGQPVEPDPAK